MKTQSTSVTAVNPETPYPAVFVLPIHNMLPKTKSAYEAARRSWIVSQRFRDLPESLAVGIAEGWTSVGAFEIESWKPASDAGKTKWEFDGTELPEGHPLARKNWRTVIDAAGGYWNYGNYIVVEFDGKGLFRVLKGSANRRWRGCIMP